VIRAAAAGRKRLDPGLDRPAVDRLLAALLHQPPQDAAQQPGPACCARGAAGRGAGGGIEICRLAVPRNWPRQRWVALARSWLMEGLAPSPH